MKKIIIIVGSIILVLGAIYYFFIREVRGTDETFLIPQGFTGCVGIYYDQEGAKPLVKKEDKIIYTIPKSGKLKTSSPQNFGWARTEDSGWHNQTFYYVNEEGKRVEKIPDEKIGYQYTNESYSDSTGKTLRSYTFYVSEKKNKLPDTVECKNY
ncbi:DUF6843 domain-containing protein [Priestia aryabhattai]